MSENLTNWSSKRMYSRANVLVCYKGVCVCMNSSSWIVYRYLLPLYLLPSHTPRTLISSQSAPLMFIHPLPALLTQPAVSPPPSPTSFSLPFSSPGTQYPLLLQLLQLISVLSPPVLSGGVRFPPPQPDFEEIPRP